MDNNVNENEEEFKGGRLIASVDIAGSIYNPDPAKWERGVTALLKQAAANRGELPAYKHPFFWHSKFRHPSSSPYTLEVNEDIVKEDKNGIVIEREKVLITEADVTISFLVYITTCHTNELIPFLNFQFEKYYNSPKKGTPQAFFDYLMGILGWAQDKEFDGLYQKEVNIICRWIATHEHYEVTESPLPSESISNSENLKLSHPEISILHHINGWIITDNNSNEIARKYGQTSGQKLKKEYENLEDRAVRTGIGKYRINNYKNIEKLVLDRHKQQYYKELEDAKISNRK